MRSSPQMMSHLLLQHSDLTDSAGHRLMTLVMTCSNRLYQQSNRSFILCFFPALISEHKIYSELDERLYRRVCVWIWLLQSVLNLIRKQTIPKTFQEETVGQKSKEKEL